MQRLQPLSKSPFISAWKWNTTILCFKSSFNDFIFVGSTHDSGGIPWQITTLKMIGTNKLTHNTNVKPPAEEKKSLKVY